MANFLLKFWNFRYHSNRGLCVTNFFCKVKFTDPENHMFGAWQQGSSEQSLTDTIKLADPENQLLRASIWAVSRAQAKL